jgi:hypothetical protein
MFKIDFLTFKVLNFVFSFKTGHVREIVHMAELHTIEDYTAALEETGG